MEAQQWAKLTGTNWPCGLITIFSPGAAIALAFTDYPYTWISHWAFDLLKMMHVIQFPVAMAEVSHPFPSRTRPLSPPAPMVLRGRHVGE